MERPPLNHKISIKDFTEFYWLKEELTNFCKNNGLKTVGGKIEITKRIQNFILTGNKTYQSKPKLKFKSNFNWNTENLNRTTVITDNYKNTENVRIFFTAEIGANFSFNVKFMKWLKENVGKTLAEAIKEWKQIENLRKDQNYVSEIAPQFEYNKYMRAFLAENPTLKSADAMKFWKLKKTQRGTNEYEKSDLLLK